MKVGNRVGKIGWTIKKGSRTGVGPSYHIDYAGLITQERVFSGPISSFSTPKSAL